MLQIARPTQQSHRRQVDLAGLRFKISSSPFALFAGGTPRGSGWTAAKKCNKYLMKLVASCTKQCHAVAYLKVDAAHTELEKVGETGVGFGVC